jgi:predicted acetylornithine/succinylornithine family transaminase
MPNYGELGLEITSGRGAWVWTRNPEGKRKKCLDLLCGLGVTSLGHCHPAVVKAIEKQSQKLMHVSNLYATGPMVELAAALAEKAGYDTKVFFCNSGTEAVEAAVKLARIWAYENFGPQKNKIVYFKNSFHGRTWMSISLTGQAKMQEKFAPGVEGIVQVKLNNIRDLQDFMNKDVCAVIFEVIQAEGGVNVMTPMFYEKIFTLSQKYDFVRIVDEVQTGIGRTGEFFAHSYLKINPRDEGPEIITMAKALGGGLPIGAVLAKGEVGDYLLPGSHAATFGGNPVACAAALAVMKEIEKENYTSQAHRYGMYFMDKLNSIKNKYPNIVKEIRGRGLMIGVELHEGYKAADVVAAMYEKGVLIGTAGPQVVRFLPPFIITEKELTEALEKFKQVIKDL